MFFGQIDPGAAAREIAAPFLAWHERLMLWATGNTTHFIRALLIPLGAFLLVRIAVRLAGRLEAFARRDGADPERLKRAQTLGSIVAQSIRVTIWSLAIVLVLGELGVDLKPIIAGAGIVGLAVGFGAQTLVKDLISGFFLLLENQIRVGDVVSAGGVTGLVESINLRTTVLRDVHGSVHIVPNGAISTVTNMTREWARAVLDIGISYEENVDRCMDVLRAVAEEFAADPQWAPMLRGPFEYPGIERFEDSAVVVRIMVQTRPLEQWSIGRELRRRVKAAFDEAGIVMPYPQRQLSFPESARLEVRLARRP